MVGVGSGIALIAASSWPNPRRRALMGLILGMVPFAALARTAFVPVLPMLVTATVAVRLVRETGPAGVLRYRYERPPRATADIGSS